MLGNNKELEIALSILSPYDGSKRQANLMT